MKVILSQDVEKIGKKDEIKSVSDGFARNFLFPKKLATQVSSTEIQRAEKRRKDQERLTRVRDKKLETVFNKLENLILHFKAKASPEGHLFGSIGQKEILDEIGKKIKEDLKEENIVLAKPIKNTGEYQVQIKLRHDIVKAVKIMIEGE